MIKTKLLPLIVAVFASSCISISSEKYPNSEEKEEQRSLHSSVGVIKDPPKALDEMPPAVYHYPGLNDVESKKSLKIPNYLWYKAIFTDGQYVRVKHDYFLKFNEWFKAATKRSFKNLGDGYDCDNFSHLYRSLMSVAAYKNNSKREVLVGVIYVTQKNSFGGIPAGKYNHALNLVCTEKGWFAFEPQTGKMCKLGDYPNWIMYYIF